MCGIVGVVSKSKQKKLISNFLTEISHRGPDSKKYLINSIGEEYIHLGSSRLSIRGDSSEDMPMVNDYGDVFVYNGEIFDMKFIESLLSGNKKYKGDTRMFFDLLHKNIQNISKVNGMYAFAYFDRINKKLFLGRDKFGIKPLFYTINKLGDIYFSSEMKSLIKFSQQEKYIHEDSIEALFLFNGTPQGEELIQGIKSVKPGELLTIDLASQNKITSHLFNFDSQVYTHLYKEDFQELMTKVVQDHLSADTSVDLFLSGGIDSSLLAHIIKTKLNKEVRHFSMSFENKSYDEKNNILQISNTLSLESKIFTFNENNTDNYVSDAISNMNSLILDYSFVPTYLLSKETSKYTKAVLSGDGADELFGGYEWYRGYLYFTKAPYKIKLTISVIIKRLNLANKRNRYLSFATKLNYFFKFISSEPLSQVIIWQSSYQNFDKRKIEIISNEVNRYIDSELNDMENLRKIDLNIFMYTNVLPKVDVASMANSLEVRPPYLDDRIVQFALNNKNSNQISMYKTKIFLREILKDTNLEFLNKSSKQGFGFPLSSWINNQGIEKIRQLYVDENLIYPSYQEAYIRDLIFKKELNANSHRELWSYFVLSTWCLDNNIKLK
tara:strand:+ start:717 stop:2546 length:1830 start_codon:yes stop_codon:yes gene_type:complete